jgi:hypothetical protein
MNQPNPNQVWRRKKYRCHHAQVAEDNEGLVCSLDLCDDEVLVNCCVTCDSYEGRDRGLGDTIKRAAEKVGVKPCGGCQKRREALNKLTGAVYDKFGNKK